MVPHYKAKITLQLERWITFRYIVIFVLYRFLWFVLRCGITPGMAYIGIDIFFPSGLAARGL
jgi:hypothetical protein